MILTNNMNFLERLFLDRWECIDCQDFFNTLYIYKIWGRDVETIRHFRVGFRTVLPTLDNVRLYSGRW